MAGWRVYVWNGVWRVYRAYPTEQEARDHAEALLWQGKYRRTKVMPVDAPSPVTPPDRP